MSTDMSDPQCWRNSVSFKSKCLHGRESSLSSSWIHPQHHYRTELSKWSLGSHAKKIASQWGPVWVGGQESACAGVSWAGELGLCTDRSTLRSQLLPLHEGQGETGDWSLESCGKRSFGWFSGLGGRQLWAVAKKKKKHKWCDRKYIKERVNSTPLVSSLFAEKTNVDVGTCLSCNHIIKPIINYQLWRVPGRECAGP